jgi:hypothetical protein
MNTYPITNTNREQKLQYVKKRNNNYPMNIFKINLNQITPEITYHKKKATFTYSGKETRIVTRVFKNTHYESSSEPPT